MLIGNGISDPITIATTITIDQQMSCRFCHARYASPLLLLIIAIKLFTSKRTRHTLSTCLTYTAHGCANRHTVRFASILTG